MAAFTCSAHQLAQASWRVTIKTIRNALAGLEAFFKQGVKIEAGANKRKDDAMKGPSEPALCVASDCLAGGGEMGALMRSMDWSKTPIGAVESWSPALRMMARLLLANRFPLLLWWGPRYCQLYNDPYRPVLGNKHPASMGQPASECFPEIWDVIGPLIDTPFNGGSATWMDDLQVEYIRYDRLEEAHFTIAYSPVPDETVPSGIGGVLATVHEITEQVVGERRLSALRDLGSRSGEAKTAEEACAIMARTLARHPEDVPFALIYLAGNDRKTAYLSGAAGIETGKIESPLEIGLNRECPSHAIWPLAQAAHSEEMQIVEDLQEKLASIPAGPWSDPPRSTVVLPIRSNIPRQLAGLLVLGLSSRLRFDDRYRDFCALVTTQVSTAIANARAYDEERKRAEALAEIDRAKTAFFSNVSHEFRTPLTLMLGPLEDELREGSHGRERLEIAYRNSLRLLKLVNTLLDFARIEAGRIEAIYEPIDLSAVTANLASMFRSAVEKAGLRLAVDCPPLPEKVYVDQEMWEKIVLNLLSNAFKFTFEGEIRVCLCFAYDRVELSVSDTGAGIPAAELSQIFKRFHRVRGTRSRTHEGTGIGLSLVEELAKMHGGGVQVWSVEGQGTIFTVTIPTGQAHLPKEHVGGRRSLTPTRLGANPFVEEALRWLGDDTPSYAPGHRTEQSSKASAYRSGSQSARILFADDNADMRAYVRHLLAQHYEVETVADGQAALERVLADPPDLVLADVMMPNLDGFGLLHRLRVNERTRTLPFIMISARAGEEARVGGLSAGADDYLIKPFSTRELIARVRTHLEMARLRRAAAEQVLENEKRFRELADTAPVMIWVTDEDGNVEFANKTYLEFFGVTLAEITGQRWKNFIHPGDSKSYSQKLLAAAAAGSSFHAEGRVRRGDGEWRWIDSWAVPRSTKSDHSPGMIGCSTDLTQRKHLEQEILAVSDREQRRIGQDLHDDLCQRLAGIQLLSDVLQRDLLAKKAEPEAEQAGLIAARIRDAIANTRGIARGLSPVAVESNGLRTALQEFAENSSRLFQIKCKFCCDSCIAIDDNAVAMHLYRIAQEAVTNAVKHGRAEKIMIRLAGSEDKYALTITDDGFGVPEAFGKNQGTGLQIMRYRAATIGASLEIGSANGRGICVTCSFSTQPRTKEL
jgi:PAS domain S-box-containing protein